MKLHDSSRSSASHRLRIALALKGVEYETAVIRLARNEHLASGYRDLNPQGLVPTLETEDGEVLKQSLAILDYLDEIYPYPALLPGHPGDRARVRAIAQIVACDIHPLETPRVLNFLQAEFEPDPALLMRWQRHWRAEGLAALESMLAGDDRTGRFCHGDTPTIADICLVPQLAIAEEVDLAPYPTLRRIFAACVKLDAFRHADPSRQTHAE